MKLNSEWVFLGKLMFWCSKSICIDHELNLVDKIELIKQELEKRGLTNLISLVDKVCKKRNKRCYDVVNEFFNVLGIERKSLKEIREKLKKKNIPK